MTFFSIIIPTFFSPRLTEVLSALKQQTYYPNINEILVVGQDHFGNLPEDQKVRIIHVEQNPSAAHNRNIGAKAANSEWICFLDADCIPMHDWLEKISELSLDKNIAIAGLIDLPYNSNYWTICDHLTGFTNQAAGIVNKTRIKYVSSSNVLIHRNTFLNLGGFNESLPNTGEDRDFCWRFTNFGGKIYLTRNAVVKHLAQRSTFNNAWKHIFQYGVDTAKFRLIHHANSNSVWKVGRFLARIPIVGEIVGLFRVSVRFLVRPIVQPTIVKKIKYWPGIFLLDYSHTLGMISALRTYATYS